MNKPLAHFLRTTVTATAALLAASAMAEPTQPRSTAPPPSIPIGIVLNNGTDLSNTTLISVATFEIVAETGNITVPLFISEPGMTFDLTNLSGLSFGVGPPHRLHRHQRRDRLADRDVPQHRLQGDSVGHRPR